MDEPAKRQKLEDSVEDEVENHEDDGLEGFGDDPDVQALQEADQLQQQLERINDEASDRVLEVEQEFNQKRRPIYAQRTAVLAKIPGFWKKVLFIHPVIRGVVSEADLDVMDYLEEVDVEDFDDIKSGYRLRFTFAEGNPFFQNRELVKELRFAEDASLSVTGTSIQWLPGKEPSAAQEAEPGVKRAFNPETEYSLFSSWFDGQGTQAMGHDDVADVLKDEIWPDPLRWYKEAEGSLGAGLDFDQQGDEFEGEDEYEDGEDPLGDEQAVGDEEVEILEEQDGEYGEEDEGADLADEGEELPEDEEPLREDDE